MKKTLHELSIAECAREIAIGLCRLTGGIDRSMSECN